MCGRWFCAGIVCKTQSQRAEFTHTHTLMLLAPAEGDEVGEGVEWSRACIWCVQCKKLAFPHYHTTLLSDHGFKWL